ncbi:MAG: sodium:calcium antiporter, partial [Lachnospiraceae bacterium]|nr:sodium:calcium antiporter [Lachnospiraceae bacterium]
ERTISGMNASLIVDIPVMLFVMALLCVPAIVKEKLSRWQGILLLCIYVGFTVFQFVG